MTRSGISLIVAALLLQAPATRAAQLDKDTCAKLKTEQAQLEQGGTRVSLSKGPEWAKTNLAPDKLEQIRRLIELDEQLLFRCGGRPLVVIPHDPDPAAREVESKDGAAKGPAAKAAKTPKADKKPAVPVKKASAPPTDRPAKAAVKEAPPVKTAPQPEAAPAQAKDAAEKKAAAPPVDQPARETAPAQMAPQPAAAPALAPTEKKKASAVPAAQPAKATPQPEVAPAPSKEEADKKAAAAKAAKAKKKANDAYSPSPVEWLSNQFGGAPPAKK